MANLKQRPDYPARGFVIASGEDLPKGQSCRARLVIIEVQRGDVDKEVLTELQRAGHAGLLVQAMSAYIQWLAPRVPELKTTLRDSLVAERDAAIQAGLKSALSRQGLQLCNRMQAGSATLRLLPPASLFHLPKKLI
jgi:hypothetical protein